MLNDNNTQSKSPSTLESLLDFFRLKAVPVVAAVAAITGCSATGTNEASDEAKGRLDTRILPKEYSVKDANQVNEALDKQIKIDTDSAKSLSQFEDARLKNLKKIVDKLPGTSADVKAFNELERQNELLYNLFKTTGIKHVLIRDLKRNVDVGSLQLPELSNDQISQAMSYLAPLKVSLDAKDLSYDARQKLSKRFGKNADYIKMSEYNQILLTLLDQMSATQAKINHHEFQLNQIASAEDLTVKINKSISGRKVNDVTVANDMYEHGEQALAAIRPLPVTGRISKESPLGEEYSDFGSKTIGALYDAIMTAAEKEAADYGRGSKHTIGQFHYFHLKSIGDQLHKAGILRDEDWIALEKVMTRDFARKVVHALPEEESVKLLPTLGKAVPLVGWYFGGKSLVRLLQNTTYSSGSIMGIVKDGTYQQYGAGTGYNRKDNNAQDLADVISTGTSMVISGIGAYLIYDHNRSSSSDSGSGGSSSGPAGLFGTEIGGPGTGP